MSKEEILAGYVQVRGHTIFSKEEVDGKRVPLLWSVNSTFVGATVMMRPEMCRVSLRIQDFLLMMETFKSFVRSKPTERDKRVFTIQKLASDTAGSDKEFILGFDPENGFWLCLRSTGKSEGVMQFMLQKSAWTGISTGGGNVMTPVDSSSLHSISYFDGLSSSINHIVGEIYCNIADTRDQGGGGGGTTQSTNSDKVDDVPF